MRERAARRGEPVGIDAAVPPKQPPQLTAAAGARCEFVTAVAVAVRQTRNTSAPFQFPLVVTSGRESVRVVLIPLRGCRRRAHRPKDPLRDRDNPRSLYLLATGSRPSPSRT